MFIKPADGLSVRDHATKTLVPAEGLEVPDHDLYWNRLLRDKDVVLAAPPAAEIIAPSEPLAVLTPSRSAKK